MSLDEENDEDLTGGDGDADSPTGPAADGDRWGSRSIPEFGLSAPFEFDPGILVGRTIDGFEVRELIGRGGFGLVYRGYQLAPGRDVAIKFPQNAGEAARALRRGGRLLGRLDHEYIATLYAVGDAEVAGTRLPYVAMEFIDGAQRITDYCRDHGIDGADRLELFAKVCDAVAAAHHVHVVHRDIKPHNILVNSRGLPRVIDFDIACTRNATLTRSQTTSLVPPGHGTDAYMSPEQDAGQDVGPSSDVFSLGIVLFALMTDCGEFKDSGLSHARKANASSLLPYLEGATLRTPAPGVRRIVDLCVRMAPAYRYEHAREVAAAVRRCIAERGWVVPWWLAASRGLTTACRGLPGRMRATLTSAACRRLAGAAARAAAAAAVVAGLWFVTTPWRLERARAAGYAAAVTAAADAFATGGPEDDATAAVAAAVHRWREWKGAAPMPLELVCLQGRLGPAGNAVRFVKGNPGLSADGRWLASTTPAGEITVADASQPKTVLHRPRGLSGSDLAIALGPGGLLAAGNAAGRWGLWKLDTIGQQSTPTWASTVAAGPVAFDFAPDGTRVAVVAADGAEVWDVTRPNADAPACRLTFAGISDGEEGPGRPAACFSGDSRSLFVAAAGGTLRVFDAHTGIEQAPVGGDVAGDGPAATLCRSADGSALASFVPGGRLRMHDPRTGAPWESEALAADGCRAAAFAPDGERLLVVRRDPGPDAIDMLDIHAVLPGGRLQRRCVIPCAEAIDGLVTGGGERVAVRTDSGWALWAPESLPPAAAVAGGSPDPVGVAIQRD